MSHYQRGKLDLNCGIGVLRQALINVLPEWEGHIACDIEGKYGLKAYYDKDNKESGYHIIVPGSKCNKNGILDRYGFEKMIANGISKEEAYSKSMVFPPDKSKVVYGDVGFVKEKNGTWNIDLDESGVSVKLGHIKGSSLKDKFIKAISAEVAKLRLKSMLFNDSFQGILSNMEENSDEKFDVFEFDIDVQTAKELLY